MKKVIISSQPDDVTCGPTSLQAVYAFFNDNISLNDVVNQITFLEEGGTLGVHLGIHALKRGYKVTIFTYNLHLFDPSWFGTVNSNSLINKLKEQKKAKLGEKLHKASSAYMEFLELGGEVKTRDLTPHLLKSFFDREIPVLTGLNSTYLYNTAREHVDEEGVIRSDDIRGVSSGHFVVLSGYDEYRKKIIVADPYSENPLSYGKYYAVNVHRLINAIMLGIVTYDANLLIIQPGN